MTRELLLSPDDRSTFSSAIFWVLVMVCGALLLCACVCWCFPRFKGLVEKAKGTVQPASDRELSGSSSLRSSSRMSLRSSFLYGTSEAMNNGVSFVSRPPSILPTIPSDGEDAEQTQALSAAITKSVIDASIPEE
jgi:hypothetical protein